MPEDFEVGCLSCSEKIDDICPHSIRSCSHHCNHIWTQDICCWCGATINDVGNLVPGVGVTN